MLCIGDPEMHGHGKDSDKDNNFKFRVPKLNLLQPTHDDVIKWKHFPRYWPYVWGIHRSQVNSPHQDQWRGALMFSLICAWINGWVNNSEAGDLRRHHAYYDVTVMIHVELSNAVPLITLADCIRL